MTAARTARAEAAHARALALKGPRWLCHVEECPDPGPHPAASPELAEAAAMRHYNQRHHVEPNPAEVEAARAAWIADGRPPVGALPQATARRVAPRPTSPLGSRPTKPPPPTRRSAWDDRTEDTWIDRL